VLSAIVGVSILAWAVALFAAPAELGEHWVWPLTPLLARTVAAWHALGRDHAAQLRGRAAAPG
jgi:hypothetical protein